MARSQYRHFAAERRVLRHRNLFIIAILADQLIGLGLDHVNATTGVAGDAT